MTRQCDIGDTAPMTAELITSVDAVTPGWMTTVLRGSGAIDDATTVATVDAESLGEGVALLSLLFRVTLTYDGGDGPATVVVKFPTLDPLQRGTADVLGLYGHEIGFYNDLASTAPFRVPGCHLALQAEDSTDFVLVMEDLGHLASVDQVAGAPFDIALDAMDTLAAFHAQWWEHDDLPTMQATYPLIDNELYRAALPGVFAGGWQNCVAECGETMDPAIRALGDRWGELVPFLLSSMATSPITLLHGDFRSDNLLLEGDEICVIDFQIMGQGAPMYDVGYFCAQSMAIEERAGRDRELIDRYLATLASHGIELDRDAAWDRYRIVLVHCFIYGVSSFQAFPELPERGQRLMLAMFERSAASILDTGALELIPK